MLASSAGRFGVTLPHSSDLVRGRNERFRLEGLVNLLAHAGARAFSLPGNSRENSLAHP
jgi:predicted XRE-type DNA-binding protein